MGLVVERERSSEEIDGLRYYVDETNQEVLFEDWFHCTDLGVQLGPVIKTYFASEQYKTRKPLPGSIHPPPFPLRSDIDLAPPVSLDSLLEGIESTQRSLFNQGETLVDAFGISTPDTTRPIEVSQFLFDWCDTCMELIILHNQTLVWQYRGSAQLTRGSDVIELNEGDMALIPADVNYSVQVRNSCCL
jgi:3-hydroxyanthranilate 3,4-dioxygenase